MCMCGGRSSVGTPGGDNVAGVATAHAEVGPAKNRAADAVSVFEVICMFSPAHWKDPRGRLCYTSSLSFNSRPERFQSPLDGGLLLASKTITNLEPRCACPGYAIVLAGGRAQQTFMPPVSPCNGASCLDSKHSSIDVLQCTRQVCAFLTCAAAWGKGIFENEIQSKGSAAFVLLHSSTKTSQELSWSWLGLTACLGGLTGMW